MQYAICVACVERNSLAAEISFMPVGRFALARRLASWLAGTVSLKRERFTLIVHIVNV